jgi:hypothetical protein
MKITPYNLHRQLLSFSELFGHLSNHSVRGPRELS